jgi:formylglycine-generating enzyme required for sulfatase activity
MADVFLSYANEDEAHAEALARAFEACGWSVWWDRKIQSGKVFHKEIQSAINEARCIVVIWSQASVESTWVYAEAEKGRVRGNLLPVVVDEHATPPIPFGQLQTTNLIGWAGGLSDPPFRELVRGMSEILGSPPVRPDRQVQDTEAGQAPTRPRPADVNDVLELLSLIGEVDLDEVQVYLGEWVTLRGFGAEEFKQVERDHRELLTSRERFGALVAAAADIAARSEDDVRARALGLHDQFRRSFIVANRLVPSSAATDEAINPRVLLSGGLFRMGCHEGEQEERPRHNVRLSPFRIQTFEVTLDEYRRFDPEHNPGGFRDFGLPADPDAAERHPVTGVNWYEAMGYAAWLGGSLPTEAQWEYAARGKEGRIYPWGSDPPTPDRANHRGAGALSTVPVGSHPKGATPEGVHDLAGNVWEWCRDWYGDYEGSVATEDENPIGPTNGEVRVLRGGSFFAPEDLRGATRSGYLPVAWHGYIGFRVAWSAAGGPEGLRLVHLRGPGTLPPGRLRRDHPPRVGAGRDGEFRDGSGFDRALLPAARGRV